METNYTQEEQIEALKRLGAEIIIREPIFENEKSSTLCRFKGANLRIESAHKFLRIDLFAWMAMDEVLNGAHKVTVLARGNTSNSSYQYNVSGVCAIEATTRAEAVYSVFMQWIREELKSK